MTLIEELKFRGFLNQCTNEETLNEIISGHKGRKAVLVNIWALWCAPCVEEFPMIVNFKKKTND